MSLGDDIKGVLQELGTPLSIYKLGQSVITGEYVDAEHYFDSSTEFVRQNCFSGDFQNDSVVSEGDLITFDNRWFLMLNVKRNLFEGSNVINSNYFIECNCYGDFKKYTETRAADTTLTKVWAERYADVHALIISNNSNIEDHGDSDFVIGRKTLYTQDYANVVVGDRWYPDVANSKEYYRIETIDRYRYKDILVCSLIEDSRE